MSTPSYMSSSISSSDLSDYQPIQYTTPVQRVSHQIPVSEQFNNIITEKTRDEPTLANSLDAIQSLIQEQMTKIAEAQRLIEYARNRESELQQFEESTKQPTRAHQQQKRWRLPAVLTQMVMDYDAEWSINFWFVCRKWRNHGSVRRSIRVPVYQIDIGSSLNRVYELFFADYFNIYFKSAQAVNVEYRQYYQSSDSDYDFIKYMDVRLDETMVSDYNQIYGNSLESDMKNIKVAGAYRSTSAGYGLPEDDSHHPDIQDILSYINANYLLKLAWQQRSPCNEHQYKILIASNSEQVWDDVEEVIQINSHAPGKFNPDYNDGDVFIHPTIRNLARGLKLEYYIVPMTIQTIKVAGLEMRCWHDPVSGVTYTMDDRLYINPKELKVHRQQPSMLLDDDVIGIVEEALADE